VPGYNADLSQYHLATDTIVNIDIALRANGRLMANGAIVGNP
jgi:hypothetical protein